MTWTLITGASRGLGATICKAFTQKGERILLHYRSSEKAAHEIQRSCDHLEMVQGDFSSREGIERFLKALKPWRGEIRNVVNNVGPYDPATLLSTTPDQFDALLQTNLHAPFRIISSLIPSLKKHRGAVVNIGVAGAGHLRAPRNAGAYQIAKQGLLMLTKTLAHELAPDHVRVNMISPGQMENTVDSIEPSQLPMGRFATLEEVAGAVVWMLDPHQSYITGQNIEVAGGYSL